MLLWKSIIALVVQNKPNQYFKFLLLHIILHIFVWEERILIKVIPAVRSPLYSLLLNSIWPPINPKHIPPVGGRKESNEYGKNCGKNCRNIITIIKNMVKIVVKNMTKMVVENSPKDHKNHEWCPKSGLIAGPIFWGTKAVSNYNKN